LPTDFSFSQNYPNPFNASTTITFSLHSSAYVHLVVFNTLGQRVATLMEGVQAAGAKGILWDASDMTSGLYFYKLTVGKSSEVKKITLLK